MAVFGNLRDMPLPDLVAMLGRRSGVLEVFGLPGKRSGYALALDGGKVLWVREGNRLLDPVEARFTLQELFRLQEGAFEFTPGVPPAEGMVLGWPLERLLLTLTTVEDEFQAYRPLLPDPKTRFQAAALEVWLEEPLWSFWERARPLLQGGPRRKSWPTGSGFPWTRCATTCTSCAWRARWPRCGLTRKPARTRRSKASSAGSSPP